MLCSASSRDFFVFNTKLSDLLLFFVLYFLLLLSISADINISACQFQSLFQALHASVITAC